MCVGQYENVREYIGLVSALEVKSGANTPCTLLADDFQAQDGGGRGMLEGEGVRAMICRSRHYATLASSVRGQSGRRDHERP